MKIEKNFLDPKQTVRRQAGRQKSARREGGGQPPEGCRPPRPRQRAAGQKWSGPRRSPEAEAGRPDVCTSVPGPSPHQAARPSPRPRGAALPSLSGASPDPAPTVVRPAGLAAAAANSSAARRRLAGPTSARWRRARLPLSPRAPPLACASPPSRLSPTRPPTPRRPWSGRLALSPRPQTRPQWTPHRPPRNCNSRVRRSGPQVVIRDRILGRRGGILTAAATISSAAGAPPVRRITRLFLCPSQTTPPPQPTLGRRVASRQEAIALGCIVSW